MNNYGQYIYHSYHYTGIAILHTGWYAGGYYHEVEADQFVSPITLKLYSKILFAKKDPVGHTCPSCANVCKNLTCTGYCCMYEPMDGLASSRWG